MHWDMLISAEFHSWSLPLQEHLLVTSDLYLFQYVVQILFVFFLDSEKFKKQTNKQQKITCCT